MTSIFQAIPFRLPRQIQGWVRAALCCVVCTTLAAAQDFFPLEEVHPGLHGVGRTVFQGNRIEQFQVEILGLLENIAPKQTIILARLSGGPLAETGVLQGMSGSPVYINGKLLGAVALGFPFSKEPIAGIQPIQAMIASAPASSPAVSRRSSPWILHPNATHWPFALLPAPSPSVPSLPGNLTQILTPLALSGFTPSTFRAFASQFEQLGFAPQQGVSSANPTSQHDSVPLAPGSMISVELLSGDMTVSAEGTVTYIHGKHLYAFGHQFLNEGSTEMPFARAEVVALLPTLSSSFKIAIPREWAGTIISDHATAIAGEIGRPSHTVPVTIRIRSPKTGTHQYHMRSVDDRFLTPFLLETALYATIDATERTVGAESLQLYERVDFENNLPPLIVRDTFTSDNALAQQAAANAVVALSFVLSSGFDHLALKNISFTLEPTEAKRELRIAQIWASRHSVHPGESVEVTVLLEGDNGTQLTRTASYRVPIGAPLGPLYFSVSDASVLNFTEFAGINQSAARSPRELIQLVNGFRSSGAAYMRVWRQEPAFSIAGALPGRELTDPPPSVALILADPAASAASGSGLLQNRGSSVAEFTLPVDGYVVSGSKTIQVNVTE
jgi:hypothetical protein